MNLESKRPPRPLFRVGRDDDAWAVPDWAFAQSGKFRFWNIHLKRTNSSLVGRLCSTGSGHGVLLPSNSGLRKCLADSERGRQTQHRARPEKATARSAV